MGVLYLVATPIGNLEDMTLRAIRVLREVDLIACEDTRHSGRLLKHFQIDTPMLSYHAHSSPERREAILQALEQGDVALISDAGMPGISDPGHELVRAALERDITVSPVPGASAITAAVPASGLVPDGFLYLGFLPRRASERQALLRSLGGLAYPLVIYEAPHRLAETLDDLLAVLGDRPLVLGRELTKLHEEISRSTLSAALARTRVHPPRGEFVLVVGAPPEPAELAEPEPEALREMIAHQLASGQTPSAVARALARLTGLPRRDIYALAVAAKGQPEASRDE